MAHGVPIGKRAILLGDKEDVHGTCSQRNHEHKRDEGVGTQKQTDEVTSQQTYMAGHGELELCPCFLYPQFLLVRLKLTNETVNDLLYLNKSLVILSFRQICLSNSFSSNTSVNISWKLRWVIVQTFSL